MKLRSLSPVFLGIGMTCISSLVAYAQESTTVDPSVPKEQPAPAPIAAPAVPKPVVVEQSESANVPSAPSVPIETSHIVQAGGSLSKIALKAYQRPGYWRILKLHNGIAPEKLQEGQEIKAPDLNWLFTDCQFVKHYPEVVKDLLEARRLFMEAEDQTKVEKDQIAPDEEGQKKIAEARKLIEKSREALLAKKEGITAPPSATVLQLRTVSRKMAQISSGTNKAAANQNLVHEHFSNAFVYSVLWARNGFK